jgi:hypothetical protein
VSAEGAAEGFEPAVVKRAVGKAAATACYLMTAAFGILHGNNKRGWRGYRRAAARKDRARLPRLSRPPEIGSGLWLGL